MEIKNTQPVKGDGTIDKQDLNIGAVFALENQEYGSFAAPVLKIGGLIGRLITEQGKQLHAAADKDDKLIVRRLLGIERVLVPDTFDMETEKLSDYFTDAPEGWETFYSLTGGDETSVPDGFESVTVGYLGKVVNVSKALDTLDLPDRGTLEYDEFVDLVIDKLREYKKSVIKHSREANLMLNWIFGPKRLLAEDGNYYEEDVGTQIFSEEVEDGIWRYYRKRSGKWYAVLTPAKRGVKRQIKLPSFDEVKAVAERHKAAIYKPHWERYFGEDAGLFAGVSAKISLFAKKTLGKLPMPLNQALELAAVHSEELAAFKQGRIDCFKETYALVDGKPEFTHGAGWLDVYGVQSVARALAEGDFDGVLDREDWQIIYSVLRAYAWEHHDSAEHGDEFEI